MSKSRTGKSQNTSSRRTQVDKSSAVKADDASSNDEKSKASSDGSEAGPDSSLNNVNIEDSEGKETIYLSDEDLMKLCQEGYEKAFEILFSRYREPSLSFIQRLTGDPSRVESLGQEAFLRIFREAKSYQYPRRFATWFYTIVRNLCKNELRWRSRHPTVSLDEPTGGGDDGGSSMKEHLSGEVSDPLDNLANAELEDSLLVALRELPDSEREVLILSRFQNFRYREIAEIVGLPMGTVRARIHSALERLRKSIKDFT